MEHEMATKPTREQQPIISRPFDDAATYDPISTAIQWPFDHPATSRYSSGAYGVWYGARTLLATIYETVHHFRLNTLASECGSRHSEPIVQERRVHLVHCSAALVDLRSRCATTRGCSIHLTRALPSARRGNSLRLLPGVITLSARLAGEDVVAVFVREAFSNPRDVCYLTYSLDPGTRRVSVERAPGRVDWVIDP